MAEATCAATPRSAARLGSEAPDCFVLENGTWSSITSGGSSALDARISVAALRQTLTSDIEKRQCLERAMHSKQMEQMEHSQRSLIGEFQSAMIAEREAHARQLEKCECAALASSKAEGEYKSQIGQLERSYEEACAVKKRQAEAISELEANIARLKSAEQAHFSQILQLQKSEEAGRIAELQEMASVQQRNAELEVKICGMRDAEVQGANSFKEFEKKNSALMQQNGELQKTIHEMKKVEEDHLSQIMRLQVEKMQVRGPESKSFQNQQSNEVFIENEVLTNQVKQAQEQIAHLEFELVQKDQSMTSRFQELQELILGHESRNLQLQAENEALKADQDRSPQSQRPRIEDLTQSNNNLMQVIAEMKQAEAEYLVQIASFQAANADQDKELAYRLVEIQELTMAHTRRNRELEGVIEEMQATEREHLKQLAEFQKAAAEEQAKSTSNNVGLEAMAKAHAQRNVELEALVTKMQQSEKFYSNQISQLQEALASITENGNKTQLSSRQALLTGNLPDVRNKLQELEQQKVEQKAEIELLKARLAASEACEADQLQTSQGLAATLDQMTSDLQERERRIIELEEMTRAANALGQGDEANEVSASFEPFTFKGEARHVPRQRFAEETYLQAWGAGSISGEPPRHQRAASPVTFSPVPPPRECSDNFAMRPAEISTASWLPLSASSSLPLLEAAPCPGGPGCRGCAWEGRGAQLPAMPLQLPVRRPSSPSESRSQSPSPRGDRPEAARGRPLAEGIRFSGHLGPGGAPRDPHRGRQAAGPRSCEPVIGSFGQHPLFVGPAHSVREIPSGRVLPDPARGLVAAPFFGADGSAPGSPQRPQMTYPVPPEFSAEPIRNRRRQSRSPIQRPLPAELVLAARGWGPPKPGQAASGHYNGLTAEGDSGCVLA